MKTVTSRWAPALVRSHPLATKATIIEPSGTETDLPIEDGSVTLDATASIRGSFDLTTNDRSLVPLSSSDPLTVYAPEIRLERGVAYPDGTTEMIPLGVFGIEDVDVDFDPIRVSGLDRAQRLARAKLEEPIEIAAGTNVGEAILTLAQSAWHDIPYEAGFTSKTALTLPKITAGENEDRWELMRGLARAVGFELFFNELGELALRAYALGEPVSTVAEGASGVLIGAGRRQSREAAFNRVIATGENSDSSAVYRGVATDLDPNSPTRYDGPFGPVPKFWSSPYIGSTEAATNAAETILAQELGISESVKFQMVPNPALEPGDTVRVTLADSGIDHDHLLDRAVIGLSREAGMDCDTRSRLVS